jgi:hypothetical protein
VWIGYVYSSFATLDFTMLISNFWFEFCLLRTIFCTRILNQPFDFKHIKKGFGAKANGGIIGDKSLCKMARETFS